MHTVPYETEPGKEKLKNLYKPIMSLKSSKIHGQEHGQEKKTSFWKSYKSNNTISPVLKVSGKFINL